MKNTFSKLICFLLLSFLSWQTATAQYKSNRVDSLISEYDYLRDSDSIGVGLPLNLSQTLPNYYRSAYLYLHDELQDQLDQLIEIGPLPKSPLTDPGGQRILEEHIAAEGRMAAKMKEIDLISKAANVSGKPLSSPQLLLSDWQLRSYHHQLLRAFALNEGFSGDGMEPFKIVYEEALVATEKELRKRVMLPESFKGIPDFQKLSQERFTLIEEVNRVARAEALHLADNSPLLLEDRERLSKLAEQIGEIDGKWPTFRDVLTEATVVYRLGVLEYGKKTVEAKIIVNRDNATEAVLHLAVLDEQLAQEKWWLYQEKNHQVIKRGCTNRGPPGEASSFNFEEPPFPKRPSPGDVTLDRFLDEAKAVSFEQKKQGAFEKVVNRQCERFKTYNLQVPQWQTYAQTTKFATTVSIKTPESFLRFLAIRRLETLSLDFVESESYKAEFDCANQRLFGKEGRTMLSFWQGEPAKLADEETSLEYAYKNVAKRVVEFGPLASPGLLHEAEELKVTLEQVKAVRQNRALKPRLVEGNRSPRPPPAVAEFPESIQNEAFHKEVLMEQKRSLERLNAWYGIDAPASVNFRLREINKTLITNDMATSIGEYKKFAEDASDLKIMERLSEFFPEFLPSVKELKARQAALFARFDNNFKRLGTLGETTVSQKISEAAQNAHKALAGGKKGAKGDGRWRPNQDLRKVKSMNLAKAPGGIWLSPAGKIQPKVALDLSWSMAKVDGDCPNPNDREWIVNPDVEKICFAKFEKPLNTQHWLNQIKSW